MIFLTLKMGTWMLVESRLFVSFWSLGIFHTPFSQSVILHTEQLPSSTANNGWWSELKPGRILSSTTSTFKSFVEPASSFQDTHFLAPRCCKVCFLKSLLVQLAAKAVNLCCLPSQVSPGGWLLQIGLRCCSWPHSLRARGSGGQPLETLPRLHPVQHPHH